jgi:hypothetical protein
VEIFQHILGIILTVFLMIPAGYVQTRVRGEVVKTNLGAANCISVELLCPLPLFFALGFVPLGLWLQMQMQETGITLASSLSWSPA